MTALSWPYSPEVISIVLLFLFGKIFACSIEFIVCKKHLNTFLSQLQCNAIYKYLQSFRLPSVCLILWSIITFEIRKKKFENLSMSCQTELTSAFWSDLSCYCSVYTTPHPLLLNGASLGFKNHFFGQWYLFSILSCLFSFK